jgi:hypothetical protein
MSVLDEVSLEVEHRALLEARSHLVHTDDTYICASVHGPRWQVVVKRKMRSPRLIDDERLIPSVTDRGNALNIRARPVGGGTHDEGAGSLGITVPGLLDLFWRRRMGEMQFGIPLWTNPPRLYS